MNRFFSLPGAVNNGMPGVPPGMGIVPPSAVPLPVPVILATATGAPLPVAVAPVPTNAVPLVAATGAAPSLKNGYPNVTAVASGTPPPHEGAVAVVNPSTNQQQQQPHMQPHHQPQPRFLYAAPPAPGSPYGAQPQLQLYAFHHPSSFYTPTVLQVKVTSFFLSSFGFYSSFYIILLHCRRGLLLMPVVRRCLIWHRYSP